MRKDIENECQTMADIQAERQIGTLISPISGKSQMGFRLAYLSYFHSRGQSHAHFDCEYPANGKIVLKLLLSIKM